MRTKTKDAHIPPSCRLSTRIPLADKVHDTLLVQCMNGIRPPGQRLNIGKLSRELNLSPTPIREARARLEHTGVVRRQALRDYEVEPPLTPTEIVQLMDARFLLEPTLASEATVRVTPEFLAELEEAIGVLESASESADGEALRQCWIADEAFHVLISWQAGNPFIECAYQSLGGQLQPFRLIGGAGIPHAHNAAHEHRRVYEAFRAADTAAATAQMRRHIESAKRRALDDERAAQEAQQKPEDRR